MFQSPLPHTANPSPRRRNVKVIDADIQSLERSPPLDLRIVVEEMVKANNSRGLLALYEGYRAAVEAFEAAHLRPRSTAADDFLEQQLDHTWACAYLIADGLSRTTPKWTDKHLCINALVRCGFDMGNHVDDVVGMAAQLNKTWPNREQHQEDT